MVSITFLGTGGGRFSMISQKRSTGGIWLDVGSQMLLDPGPGSLIRALQYGKDPSCLDAVLVSHKHLDHYGDTEVMVEAMTYGGKKERGKLVCPENALRYISDYHVDSTNLKLAKPGDRCSVGNCSFSALPTVDHADGLGFRFETSRGEIVYSGDTDFSAEVSRMYSNARLLVLNVIFPPGPNEKPHLTTSKAVQIVDIARPKLCVITHFALRMIEANPEKQAKFIEDETGIETIAAQDGQEITL